MAKRRKTSSETSSSDTSMTIVAPSSTGATGGRSRASTHVSNKENIIPSTLLFAHMPIDDTIKKYSNKSKKPSGGPAFAENRRRIATRSHPDDSDSSDGDDMEDRLGNQSVRGSTKYTRKHREATSATDHNVRVEGGHPPSRRRITSELNSDDEIILSMKQDKRTDREIAQTLADAGRVKYSVKTISSRYKRLRMVVAKQRDDMLDRKEAHWSAAEDLALLAGVRAADLAVERMKREADAQKWELVTHKIRDVLPSAIYSKRACQERFDAIQNGTATIPVELRASPIHVDGVQTQQDSGTSTAAGQKDDTLIHKSAVDVQNNTSLDSEISSAANRAAQHLHNQTPLPLHSTTIEHAREHVDESVTHTTIPSALLVSTSTMSGIDDNRTFSVPVPTEKPVRREITALSHRAMVASEAEKPDPVRDLGDLKDVGSMKRNEMRDELKARGLVHDGKKEVLAATIEAARAGATDIKVSPIRGDLNLRSLGRDSTGTRPDLNPEVIKANRERYIDGVSTREGGYDNQKGETTEVEHTDQLGGGTDHTSQDIVTAGLLGGMDEETEQTKKTRQLSGDQQQAQSTSEEDSMVGSYKSADLSEKRSRQSSKEPTTASSSKTNDTNPWQRREVSKERAATHLSMATTYQSYVFEVTPDNAQNQGQRPKFHQIVLAGRRVFLTNFPEEYFLNDIHNMLSLFQTENIHTVGVPGSFMVDFKTASSAGFAVDAFDGTIVKDKTVSVDNAHNVARAYQKSVMPPVVVRATEEKSKSVDKAADKGRTDREVSKLSSSSESSSEYPVDDPANGDGYPAYRRRVIISNVHHTATIPEMNIVFGKPLHITAIATGTYLVEYKHYRDAMVAIGTLNGFRFYNELLKVKRVPRPSHRHHSSRPRHQVLTARGDSDTE